MSELAGYYLRAPQGARLMQRFVQGQRALWFAESAESGIRHGAAGECRMLCVAEGSHIVPRFVARDRAAQMLLLALVSATAPCYDLLKEAFDYDIDGTIKTSRCSSLSTSIPGVFAAGDIVRGASLVVWAVRDGQDAAAEIHAWLQAETQAPRLLVGADFLA